MTPQGHTPQIQVVHAIGCVLQISLYGGVALCKKKELLGILKGKGIKVEYLRCDNAG